METAVIVRENYEHAAMRTAVVDRDIAQALALKGGYLILTRPRGLHATRFPQRGARRFRN